MTVLNFASQIPELVRSATRELIQNLFSHIWRMATPTPATMLPQPAASWGNNFNVIIYLKTSRSLSLSAGRFRYVWERVCVRVFFLCVSFRFGCVNSPTALFHPFLCSLDHFGWEQRTNEKQKKMRRKTRTRRNPRFFGFTFRIIAVSFQIVASIWCVSVCVYV